MKEDGKIKSVGKLNCVDTSLPDTTKDRISIFTKDASGMINCWLTLIKIALIEYKNKKKGHRICQDSKGYKDQTN